MHVPVLLQEVVLRLDPQAGDIVVDATVGLGGHACVLGKKIGKEGMIVGIDEDEKALKIAEEKLKSLSCRVCLAQRNFRDIDKVFYSCGIENADIMLFDLGMSSLQLEYSGRGFSFKSHEPLLMTMRAKPTSLTLTAYEIVNYWKEEEIAGIIREYGEETRAKEIARAIIRERSENLIGYADDLAEIIEKTIPKRGRLHPATKTFQALRVAVNDEINALKEGLQKGLNLLKKNGRMGVISFHSLEDRVVKQFFKSEERVGRISILTKKPIMPTRAEIIENPRARSAKLRIMQKI
mgnify:CR=1 FL=1